MMTGIEGVAVQATVSGEASPIGQSGARSSDVERFQAVLAAGDPGAANPATPAPGPAVLAPAQAAVDPAVAAGGGSGVAGDPSTRPASLGSVILETLESSSSKVKTAWSQSAQSLERPDLPMTEVLRLQMAVLEASIHYDLMSKGISKSNQSLDQLLRTQ